MRITAQIFLVIFFVILSFFVLVSATLKFKLLNYSFWTATFVKHDVYSNLSQVVKNTLDTQIGKSGGSTKDIALLTDLITSDNTTTFINKNLFNLLNFMNGKTAELNVYVPIDKIPSGLLPKSVTDINQEMTLNDLSTRFNIVGLENLPFKSISKVGLYDYYFLMGTTSLAGVVLILIMLLVGQGARFIAPGIALVLSGGLILGMVQYVSRLNDYMSNSVLIGGSLNKVVVFTLSPPVLTEVAIIWTFIGVILIVIGILLFFIKTKSVVQKIPLN